MNDFGVAVNWHMREADEPVVVDLVIVKEDGTAITVTMSEDRLVQLIDQLSNDPAHS